MQTSRIARANFVAALLALSTLCRAQGAPQLAGQVIEEFGGARGQSAPGGLVVGVIQGPAAGRADLRPLRALMPQPFGSQLVCFRATTFDSVYSANGSLRARPGEGGVSRIGDAPFPQRNDELRRYPGDELAISLVLSRDCDLLPEKRLTFVPASFGGPSNLVRIALNTRRPERLGVSLSSVASVTSRAQCRALDERSAKSFHYVCDLKLEPTFGAGKATLAVTRKLPGAPEKTVEFDLIVHDPLKPIVDSRR